MILINELLLPSVVSSAVRPGYHSDHSMVTSLINVPHKKRSAGLWKFNEYLLDDDDHKKLEN